MKPANIDRAARQFQAAGWSRKAFGEEQTASVVQRALRFGEESDELKQAAGIPYEQAADMLAYVYARPVGELRQEMGGVGVTLLLLANAAGLDADTEEDRELKRVLSKPPEYFTKRNNDKNAAGLIAGALAPQKAEAWAWYYATAEDAPWWGQVATREEAIAAGRAEHGNKKFYVCRALKGTLALDIDADQYRQLVNEQNEDNANEDGELPSLEGWKDEDVAELMLQINRVIQLWAIRRSIDTSAWAFKEQRDMEEIYPASLPSLLQMLVGFGGQCCANDTPHAPVAPWCSEKEDPDVFNAAINAGFVRCTHSDCDESTAYITDAGREWLAANQAKAATP